MTTGTDPSSPSSFERFSELDEHIVSVAAFLRETGPAGIAEAIPLLGACGLSRLRRGNSAAIEIFEQLVTDCLNVSDIIPPVLFEFGQGGFGMGSADTSRIRLHHPPPAIND